MVDTENRVKDFERLRPLAQLRITSETILTFTILSRASAFVTYTSQVWVE